MLKTTIDICIATFNRPVLLKRLLVSLNRLQVNDQNVKILVIDNDKNESGREIVNDFKLTCNFQVIYDVEQEPGISFVRNKLIKLSDASFIAFLDDDEIVKPDWLINMYTTMISAEADVVFGPVVSVLPVNAQEWIKEHPCFNNYEKSSGSVVEFGGTGNVLIRSSALGVPIETFNSSFALTGGSDTEFFYRLHKKGKKLIWCNEAIAMEYVPDDRLTVRWVCLRAFRGGQCYSRIFSKEYSSYTMLKWNCTKLFQIIFGMAVLPSLMVVSYPLFVKILTRICGACGQLSVLLFNNYLYREYSSIHYQSAYSDKKKASPFSR